MRPMTFRITHVFKVKDCFVGILMKTTKIRRLCALLAGLTPMLSLTVSAKCGGVDYSWGADALAMMHDYVVTMMLYVLYIAYAVAGIVVVVASLQIYIKMNTGEEGIIKQIMMVVGACIFLISAAIVLPAMFGYRI